MSTPEQLFHRLIDVDVIRPAVKRSQLTVAEVLVDAPAFAVARLTSGKFACCWEAHAYVADTLDELKAELNHAEKALLPA